MEIDTGLKKKLGPHFSERHVEVVWLCVENFFDRSEDKFVKFLDTLDPHNVEKCIRTLFFYLAHKSN